MLSSKLIIFSQNFDVGSFLPKSRYFKILMPKSPKFQHSKNPSIRELSKCPKFWRSKSPEFQHFWIPKISTLPKLLRLQWNFDIYDTLRNRVTTTVNRYNWRNYKRERTENEKDRKRVKAKRGSGRTQEEREKNSEWKIEKGVKERRKHENEKEGRREGWEKE